MGWIICTLVGLFFGIIFAVAYPDQAFAISDTFQDFTEPLVEGAKQILRDILKESVEAI